MSIDAYKRNFLFDKKKEKKLTSQELIFGVTQKDLLKQKEVNNRIMRADFEAEDESDGEDNEFLNLLNQKGEEDDKDKRVNLAKTYQADRLNKQNPSSSLKSKKKVGNIILEYMT